MRLFWLGAAWLGGIAAGAFVNLPVWAWAGCALAAAGAFRLARTNPPAARLLLGLAVAALGAARLQIAQPELGPSHVARLNDLDRSVTLTGVVIEPPDVRDAYTGLRLKVETVQLAGEREQRAQGVVLLRAQRFEPWAYGDRIEATGFLETPPVFETFSYRDYLARQGIHSLMTPFSARRLATRQASPLFQLIYDYRALAEASVRRLFPDPEASLLSGILLGIESQIAPEVRQAFNATGTSHIIAISGFNITIVASVFVGLFGRWLGPRRGGVVAGAAIAGYTLLAGADAAVVRAAVMGGLVLIARHLGRQTQAMASLGATAVAMTLANPLTLWDVGFQLSFAATLGLVLYADSLQGWFTRIAARWSPEHAERLAGPVSEYFLFTLAAQATTLPLMMYYFNRLSLVSFAANPFILPLQPAVMIVGGLAAMAGTLWTPLGQPLAWIAWPFVALTIRLVEYFAAWPAASVPLGRVKLPVAALVYACLFGFTAVARLPEARRPKLALPPLPAGLGLAALAIVTGLTWRLAADRPDGLLHMTVLDVGPGDAVLIASPTGRYVLVDGGASPVALSEALGRRLPLVGRGLDWAVLTTTGEEQTEALGSVVDQIPVGGLLVAGPPGGRAYRQLLEALAAEERPVEFARAGQSLDLGGGARLEVAAIGEHGAILLLTYGRARFLLPMGADPALAAEALSGDAFEGITAVLLAEGGYVAVNPPEWLRQVRPWIAVASVEAGNKSGLPSPEVLEALEGATVLRTDRDGWIELATDGLSLWTEAER